MNGNGKKNWFIVDGWMPSREQTADAGYEGHECIMILNCNDRPADVRMDIFYSDKDPVEDIKIAVPAKRIIALRSDNPDDMGGVKLGRREQYSLRIRSDVEIVVQYGRMDVTQTNLAYLSVMGYSE